MILTFQALYLHEHPQALAQRQTWLDDLLRLLPANRVERFAYAEEIAKDTEAFQNLLQIWVSFWRDVMLQSARADTPLTNLDRQTEIETIAGKIKLSTAKEMVSRLEKMQYLLNHYSHTRLTAEVLMLDIPRLK